jgi:ATP-binding protein involved in chromosome partitioning
MKSYDDIPGDGGSRIVDQVAKQRERIDANLSGIGHLLAIGSGKGGVGKSTLTIQLASALRQKGVRVAVLDADINAPAQAHLGHLEKALLVPGRNGLALPKTREGVGVISTGTLFPEPAQVELGCEPGGDSHIWRASREFSALGQLLATVEWGTLDLLLIDLPPGTERTLQMARFLTSQAAFLLVTIPTELARGVVARTVAGMTRIPNRLLGYVENMAGYYCAECGEVRSLFPCRDVAPFDAPCLGTIPFDPLLAEWCDRGESLNDHPETPCSMAIREIAARVYEVLENGS